MDGVVVALVGIAVLSEAMVTRWHPAEAVPLPEATAVAPMCEMLAALVVPGVVYTSASHPIPGVGMLTIDSLGGDQKARKTKSGGKAVLLKGSTFTAKFQVTVPAQVVSGPTTVPDPNPQYSGNGQFITTNLQVKGT